jgi:hypothetical protein
VANLQPEAFLEVAGGDADRIERLDVLERALDVGDRPLPHRRHLLDRGDEVAVVVEIADDGATDLAQPVVARLQGELPEQVVRERPRRRQGVLDRRELFDLGGSPRTVAVVEVVAEEILVVGVVPAVGLFRRRLVGFRLFGLLLFSRLELFGRNLLE